MYVCVYMYTYICIYVCMYIRMYIFDNGIRNFVLRAWDIV